jgi:hypothetical protein
MKIHRLKNIILYDADYILRDSKGNPIRYKTSKEIKKEIQQALK